MALEVRCERCQDFTLQDFQGHGVVTHCSAARLLDDGPKEQRRCKLCAVIRDALLPYRAEITQFWQSYKVDLEVRLVLQAPDRAETGTQADGVEITRHGAILVLAITPSFRQNLDHIIRYPRILDGLYYRSIPIYGEPGLEHDQAVTAFPPKRMPKFRLLSKNGGAASCLHLAADYLSTCRLNHGDLCRQLANVMLPARLVDVGPQDGSRPPILVETRGKQGVFAALSYCWGKESFMALELSNIRNFKRQIPMGQLPATVRDAIILTRWLGIPYLWVDSLCILQGNQPEACKDWEETAGDMVSIYGSAFLTIAATGSSSADEGLFRDRLGQDAPCCRVPLSRIHGNTIHFGKHQRVLHQTTPRCEKPLAQRGWAFQEKVLSHRVLSYGYRGLEWSCPSATYAEFQYMPVEKDSEPVSPKDLRSQWTSLVEEYSARDLTRLTDRLPAIQGLAQFLCDETKHCYLLGLWRDQLQQQLLWRHKGQNREGTWFHRRQTTYRAPTWSWASVDGGVVFLHKDAAPTSIFPFSVRRVDTTLLEVIARIKNVTAIQYKITGKNYGVFRPVEGMPPTLETYLDDLEEIPEDHRGQVTDSMPEINDVWFMFVTADSGIILLKENRNDSQWTKSKWLLWPQVLRSPFVTNFRRISVPL